MKRAGGDRKVDKMSGKPTKPDMAGKNAKGQGTGKKPVGGMPKAPGKTARKTADKRKPTRV